jgi:hypothetical protein
MRKILSGVIAAGFVATVGLSAQEPPPISAPGGPGGAQRSTPSAQATSGQSKTVTLSGCIQNAPAASASASAAGAQASASASPKFVLSTKGAAGAGASASSAVGTSGSETRYQLSGDEKTISPHLNHQVEITGTVENSAGAGGAGAGAGAAASGPMLKVESVKMVSATCS